MMQDGLKLFKVIDLILHMIGNTMKWARNAWEQPRNENNM